MWRYALILLGALLAIEAGCWLLIQSGSPWPMLENTQFQRGIAPPETEPDAAFSNMAVRVGCVMAHPGGGPLPFLASWHLCEEGLLLDGTYTLCQEVQGFSGETLELHEGQFRYWFYSDVVSGNEPTYPLTGRYSLHRDRLVLHHAQLHGPIRTVSTVNGIPVLWRDDGLNLWREQKRIHPYAVLLKVKRSWNRSPIVPAFVTSAVGLLGSSATGMVGFLGASLEPAPFLAAAALFPARAAGDGMCYELPSLRALQQGP